MSSAASVTGIPAGGAPEPGASAARPSSAIPSLAVIVVSYQRPDDLARCLGGLRALAQPADEVIVVAQRRDAATVARVERETVPGDRLRLVTVDVPGMIAARNAGIEAAGADLLAFIDDDTVVAPDWSRRIVAHFAADPAIGALGGRDRCHDGTAFDDREAGPVGRIQWFGRPIGNHHLGFGPARDVEWLKGANMTYRREALGALRFSADLRGSKAQPADDIAFSLAVKKKGWRVVYDPEVRLDHYTGRRAEVRHYVASHALADPAGYYDFCFNSVVAVWPYLPPVRRAVHAGWSLLVGVAVRPGLLQAVRLTRAQRGAAWHRFAIAQRAQWDASRRMLRRADPAADATRPARAPSGVTDPGRA